MNTNHNTGLHGTKTEKNLADAAKNESLAFTKYTIYSDIAHEQGHHRVAEMFKNLAKQEREHAELWLGYLGEYGDTADNLNDSVFAESYQAGEYYPSLSETAAHEGFDELADKFRMAGKAEQHHGIALSALNDEMTLGTMYEGNEDTEWECTCCGYTTKGNAPSERCPLCGYPKSYSKKLN